MKFNKQLNSSIKSKIKLLKAKIFPFEPEQSQLP